MAWAGARQEGALQEGALQEGALQEGLVGSLNLLRLGWLSLRAPGILVVEPVHNYEIITGRPDGSARCFW